MELHLIFLHLQEELKLEKGFQPHNQIETKEQESYCNQMKRHRFTEKKSDGVGEKLKGIAYEDALDKERKLFAKLKQEAEYKDRQILKMQHEYDEMLASFRQVVKRLTEKIKIKDNEMELMHQDNMKMLHDEAARLKGAHVAENRKLQSKNWELESALAWKNILLEASKTQKHLECRRLDKEKEEITLQRTELEGLSEALQSLESLNNAVVLNESTIRPELQDARNESMILRTQLEEISETLQYHQSLNNTLIMKEIVSRQELQEARSESMAGLKDLLNNRTTLVIKRLGEMDQKVFQEACSPKFPNGDWEEMSAKLCSTWEEYLPDANWQPFKTVGIKGQKEEIVDEDDVKLKELRDKYGETVYNTVVPALLEMIQYNPSGRRYPVPEIWNSRKERIATMKEIIQY